ncbi:hypothetical protein RSO01_57840 [Reyranella soli]|uniref:Uncharacterized protein n=1 Tax=Reyranella soli TaxID=1230389 RepID=A0A512NI38_9HYPH|nr:hypothetical protein RSO01_57840 [Reyranella soli]
MARHQCKDALILLRRLIDAAAALEGARQLEGGPAAIRLHVDDATPDVDSLIITTAPEKQPAQGTQRRFSLRGAREDAPIDPLRCIEPPGTDMPFGKQYLPLPEVENRT